jgi:translation initiation factor IF-1
VAKEEGIKLTGEVVELLPNTMFRCKLENDNIIVAYLSGKMRQKSINILLGDMVELEFSPYDLSKARIVYRNK